MLPTNAMKGRVFNLQRFSTKDGPGIRTTVFLKGCNLQCLWCHNPESLSGRFELKYQPESCIFCAGCAAACPEKALRVEGDTWALDASLCTLCGDCVRACPTGALGMWGRDYEPNELVDILLKDREYYQDSGGGVTFSGGEPLLQAQFLVECMSLLKKENIHTAVDTALQVKWSIINKVLPYTDLLLVDVKGVDPAGHLENTSVKPDRIRENINRLKALQNGPVITVRLPLVKGRNDDPPDLPALVELLSDWPALNRIELLPCHSLGAEKAKHLVSGYRQEDYEPPTDHVLHQFEMELEAAGLPVKKSAA